MKEMKQSMVGVSDTQGGRRTEVLMSVTSDF